MPRAVAGSSYSGTQGAYLKGSVGGFMGHYHLPCVWGTRIMYVCKRR